MRKNIWFIMGSTMLITTLLILIIQGCTLYALTPSPDDVRPQLEPFDRKMKEFDPWLLVELRKELGQNECPDKSRESGECWIYSIGLGNVILVEGYADAADLYAYDFDGDERIEILKWDLGRDGQFDVIEYDVDGDGMLDYATVETNDNELVDNDEIYMYHSIERHWRPLFPGALPFPVLPVFPY